VLFRSGGGALVIINDGETPLDSLADQRYHELHEVFSYLKTNL